MTVDGSRVVVVVVVKDEVVSVTVIVAASSQSQYINPAPFWSRGRHTWTPSLKPQIVNYFERQVPSLVVRSITNELGL